MDLGSWRVNLHVEFLNYFFCFVRQFRRSGALTQVHPDMEASVEFFNQSSEQLPIDNFDKTLNMFGNLSLWRGKLDTLHNSEICRKNTYLTFIKGLLLSAFSCPNVLLCEFLKVSC